MYKLSIGTEVSSESNESWSKNAINRSMFSNIIWNFPDRSPNHVLPFEDVTWHCDTHEEIAFSYSAHSRPHSTTKKHPAKRYFTNRRLLTPTQEFGSAFWQGSCVQGQLTARGARQLETLGSIMREIYIERMHLLHDKYKHGRKQWWVRSTDIWYVATVFLNQTQQSDCLSWYHCRVFLSTI